MPRVFRDLTRLTENGVEYSRADRALIAMAKARQAPKFKKEFTNEEMQNLSGTHERATFYRVVRQMVDSGLVTRHHTTDIIIKTVYKITQAGIYRVKRLEDAKPVGETTIANLDKTLALMRTLDEELVTSRERHMAATALNAKGLIRARENHLFGDEFKDVVTL